MLEARHPFGNYWHRVRVLKFNPTTGIITVKVIRTGQVWQIRRGRIRDNAGNQLVLAALAAGTPERLAALEITRSQRGGHGRA